MKTVDVIIPVYKPTVKIIKLIEMLEKQTVPVNKIILMNTEEKYYNQFFYGKTFLDTYSNIMVRHLSKREFDHGGTRNRGVKLSNAEYFVCMTDDAIPFDERLIEELLRPFEDEGIAVSYGRQLANPDSGPIERYTRKFNYPKQSMVKSKEDIKILGIKTYFCSNVCAAYRRDSFDALGGFVSHTIFNEDMLFAAKAVAAGCSIAYVSEAKVYHCHNYTYRQQFHRNFDMGVSQADHPDVFQAVPPESEGMKLVKQTTEYLKKKGLIKLIPSLYIQSACKLIGYKLGKNYQRLPKWLVRKCTMNQAYWLAAERKRDVSRQAENIV